MARQQEGFLEGRQEVSQGQDSAPHVWGRDGPSSAIHVEERRGSDQWDGSEAIVGRGPQPLLGEGSEEVCAGGQGGRSAKGEDEVLGLRENVEGTSVWESRECDSGLVTPAIELEAPILHDVECLVHRELLCPPNQND
jgi:hypothetical protein